MIKWQLLLASLFLSACNDSQGPNLGPVSQENPKLEETRHPLPQETLTSKPIQEEARETIPSDRYQDTRLPSSSKLCSDSSFGKDGLEACLTEDPSQASIYNNLEIQFSLSRKRGEQELIKKDLVEANFSLIDSHDRPVDGRIYWLSDRVMSFDPTEALRSDEAYRLRIESNPSDDKRPHSNFKRALSPYSFTFKSPAPNTLRLSINDIEANSSRGIILDHEEFPLENLVITAELLSSQSLAAIRIRRLGSQSKLVLCKQTCPTSMELSLADHKQLRPQTGLNTYIYELEDQNGKKSHHHISFNWGRLAQDPDRDFERGLVAAVDRSSLDTLGHLVSNFAAGKFTLDYIDESGQVQSHKTFNDIIRINERNFKKERPDHCLGQSDKDFSYIGDLGPFCNIVASGQSPMIGGLLGSVNYSAIADIYVKNLEVTEQENNLSMGIHPRDGYMDMDLKVKEYKGTLRIVLHVTEAKYIFGLPVDDAVGYFTFETDFVLSGQPRSTLAKAKAWNDRGNQKIRINGIDSANLKKSVNGSPESLDYFDTKQWHDGTQVKKARMIADYQGPWTSLVNLILTQALNSKVDEFKPEIVNGMARDMIQVVASKLLNTNIQQLKSGLTVPFPDFLPSPLNKINASVKGQLSGKISIDEGYLSTGLKGKLSLNPPQGLAKTPPAAGFDSFLMQSPKGFAVPHPLRAGPVESPGSLLSVDIDLLNQALYQAWKQGILNLTVDKAFVETIEGIAVFDPVNATNGKEILFAEFIPKLMGRRIDRMIGLDPYGATLTMDKEDIINIQLKPLLPPILKMEMKKEAGRLKPRFILEMGDMVMNIKGLRDGTSYKIASLKTSVRSESKISFGAYSNPFFKQRFSGVGAVSIQVLGDVKSLDFAVQAYEDKGENPFAIDIQKLRNAVADMVDSLFIPLVNDGLRELPLDGLRTCGIELDAAQIKILDLAENTKIPYIRVQAPLKSYEFSGNCQLQPDFETQRPPLPPKPDDKGDEIVPLPDNGQSYPLDMDFTRLPFQLNGSGRIPEVAKNCRSNLFFEASCASASVVYFEDENGEPILDARGRKSYHYTSVQLLSLVRKDEYQVRAGSGPSIEGKFFDFNSWGDYVADFRDNIVFHESIGMKEVNTDLGTFLRHYTDYETNSPKASGFIPIRTVTYHRVLDQAFQGAEISTEFFANTSKLVETPEGRPILKGTEGVDFHTGNIHIVDCGTLDWCSDDSQWLVIYESQISPEDKSIPEDVLPYLKRGLNSIMAGMFQD